MALRPLRGNRSAPTPHALHELALLVVRVGNTGALLMARRRVLGCSNPSYHCQSAAGEWCRAAPRPPGQGPGSPCAVPSCATRCSGPSTAVAHCGPARSTDRARQTRQHGVPTSVIASTWRARRRAGAAAAGSLGGRRPHLSLRPCRPLSCWIAPSAAPRFGGEGSRARHEPVNRYRLARDRSAANLLKPPSCTSGICQLACYVAAMSKRCSS